MVESTLFWVSTALIFMVCCCLAAKLLKVIVPTLLVAAVPQGEKGLLSRLHWNPAIGLEPAVACTLNIMDVEEVEPPFDTVLPLPSTADIIVVLCGGCRYVTVQLKVAEVRLTLFWLSTVLTLNICCPGWRLL